MNKQLEQFPIAKVQAMNWILLFSLVLAAGLAFSWKSAEGVLIGGLLANLSFIALKRNLTKVFAGPLQVAKLRFFINYYARLTAVAFLLYVLVRYWHVNIFGLLAGLSTVVVSILVIGVGEMRRLQLLAKGAA